MMQKTKPIPVRNCWDLADETIIDLHHKMKNAIANNMVVTAHKLAHEIDSWLDFRLEHGPTDMIAE